MRCLRGRQHHLDPRARAGGADNGDAAAMRLGDRLADSQAEPRPALAPRAAGVDAVEAVEDMGQVLRRDPFAAVSHPEMDLAIPRLATDGHTASRRSVRQRVVDEVDEELDEEVFVGDDRRGHGLAAQDNAGVLCLWRVLLDE